jgi:UDP-glucose 4-epimerase
MNKAVVVTGGAGFIGSHMVDLLLSKGYSVRVIDNLISGRLSNLEHHKNNSRLSVLIRDLCEIQPDDSVFQGVDYVFHFAGKGDIVPSIEHPIDYLTSNVMGTVHALEAARNAGVRKFVYAASSSCYGIAEELPTTETASIRPQYPYALSKYLAEQAVLHWGSVYKVPVISLRIFNAYGPRSRTTGAYGAVFGVFLKQKISNKPYTIVGDGTQIRDFIFVTDVAQAFYKAALSKHIQEIYNLGTGTPQSVNRLVDLLGGGTAVYVPKRPGEPDCTWADISKIKKHLSWEPVVSFEDGVSIILKNIDYWKDAPLWDEASIADATAEWFKLLGMEGDNGEKTK